MTANRTRKTMSLGVSINAFGGHFAAWRRPGAPTARTADVRHYVKLAQIAERGKLDHVFIADAAALDCSTNPEGLRRISQTTILEPMVLLSAIAMGTKHIGLVGSATTTYNEPYHIARIVASLDQISGGRAGWNLVTSTNETEAWNFNREAHVDHATRYKRAAEFAQVVMGLWDGWEDDAFIYDQAEGLVLDLDKMHVLNHKGDFFGVKGPTPVPRSPQGRPVIFQAGSSEVGKELAAEIADAVFTVQQNVEDAKAFCDDVKGRAARFGRAASDIRILPGLTIFVGASREEAEAKREELNALIHPEAGLALLMELVGGFDLRAYPLDGPFPEISETNAGQGRLKVLADMARKGNLTIRQLYAKAASRGHLSLCGTPSQVADEMERWFTSGACDGFNLMPPFFPEGLEQIVDLVVPELQRRGLFRSEYEGTTLRDNLGVARPENAFAAARDAAPPSLARA